MSSVASRGLPLSPLETRCAQMPSASSLLHFIVYVKSVRSTPLSAAASRGIFIASSNIPASLQLARCLPLPSAASRCLPLPPVVSRCLRLCAHDLPLSPAASHCLSSPPGVSSCLPLSPVGPRCRTLFHVASRCLLSYPKLWASICRCLTPFAGRKNDIR